MELERRGATTREDGDQKPSPYAPIVDMPSRSILRCQQALNAAQTTGTAKVMAKATAVLSTQAARSHK